MTNKEELNNLLKSSKTNISPEAIKKAKQTGNADELIKNLSSEDKAKLNTLLNDKAALEKLLKSPQAAAIMNLFGGKNG